MTHCPNCLRHTATDVIPAIKYAGSWIPGFVCCRFCGWCITEINPEEEATA